MASKGVLPMWCVAGHHVSICSTNTENARSTEACTRTLLRTTASSMVFAMLFSRGRLFRGGLKCAHGACPHLVEVRAQAGHAHRVELIQAARTGFGVCHQA